MNRTNPPAGHIRRPSRTARPWVESLDGRQLLSGLAPHPAPHREVAATPSAAMVLGLPTAINHAHLGRIISDITYNRHGSQSLKLDLYLPSGSPPPGGWPVILAFPGDGWRQADRKDYGGAVSVLTDYGYAVEGVDTTYAKDSGGHTWPTNLEDARAAVRWTRAHSGRFGLNPAKVVAMGESAGAHVALLLGTDPGDPTSGGSAQVQAVVDFYGPTDLATLYAESRPEVRPFFGTFLGGLPSQYPTRYADASPINHVSASTPPTLIMQGLIDRTVLPSQSFELDAALTAAGVRHRLVTFDGITHGFRFSLGGYSLLPDVVGFLDGALNGGSLGRRTG